MNVFNNNQFLFFSGDVLTLEQAYLTAKMIDDQIVKGSLSLGYSDIDEVREVRAALLTDADISINKAEDAGKDTQALRQYRQALRDVTAQNFDFNEAFNPFPAKPAN